MIILSTEMEEEEEEEEDKTVCGAHFDEAHSYGNTDCAATPTRHPSNML